MNKYKYCSATLDVTEECNLCCDYCFTYSQHEKKTLSLQTGKDILKFLCENFTNEHQDYIDLAWWGGEPLLEFEKIKQLTEYTKELTDQYGIPFSFGGTTNGVLLTEDKYDWCQDNSCFWLISYDGIQPSHDCFRKFKNGVGSWKTVNKNIMNMKKAGMPVSVRISVSVDTIKYFYDNVVHIIEELGVYDFAFSPVFEGDWTDDRFNELKEQYIKSVDYVINRMKNGDEKIYLKHLNDEAVCFINKKDNNYFPCGAGNKYVGFSTDGFMYPCHRFNKHGKSYDERLNSPITIGRYENGTIIEMNNEFREKFITFQKNPSEKCKGCDIFKVSPCDGGCYALNFDLTGDPKNQADVTCKHSHILREVGEYYYNKALEYGIKLSRSRVWHGNVVEEQELTSCICNNCCYLEGTDREITHINKNVKGSCMCNQTTYASKRKEQYRTLDQIEQDNKNTKKLLDLSRRILLSKNVDKTDEQKDLEDTVIKKTIELLDKKCK